MIKNLFKNKIREKLNFLFFILVRLKKKFYSYWWIYNSRHNVCHKKIMILNFSILTMVYNYFLLCFYQLLIRFNRKIFGLGLLFYIDSVGDLLITKSSTIVGKKLNFYFNYLSIYYNILKFLKYKYFSNVFVVNHDNYLFVIYLFFYYKQYFNSLSFLFYYKFFILLQIFFFNVICLKEEIKTKFYIEKKIFDLSLFNEKVILNSILSKNLIYKFLKKIKTNPVVFFLYNNFFFKKKTYNFYYSNTVIFQLL